jgi:medium-chain acyl-[acyl-carrier-protein] hydrolase
VSHLDLPYVLFGHSFGSWVIFETARRLASLNCRLPAHLVLAGFRGPSEPRDDINQQLPEDDDTLLQIVETHYDTERLEMLQHDPVVRAWFLPALRSDLEAMKTFPSSGDAPLPVPLTVFGGLNDPSVGEESLATWRTETAAAFQLTMLEGDHFFVHSKESKFLDHLLRIIESAALA